MAAYTETLDRTTSDGLPAPKPIAVRDNRSDYLKAAAILGVVCIHAGLPYCNSLRFCMPVFVTLWAFHVEGGLSRRGPEQVWPYLVQRFWRLLIPYLFWTALYLVSSHSFSEFEHTPVHTVVGGWLGGYGWPGQYFFIIIFQLIWLMPLLRGWVNRRSIWLALVAGLLINAFADYLFFRNSAVANLGDRLSVYWLGYVFMGIAFARGYPRASYSLLLIALISLVAAPYEFAELARTGFRASPYLLPSVMLGSITLLLAIGPRFSDISAPWVRRDNWLKKFILFIGQNSLVIFVANPLLLEGSRRLGFGLPQWGVLLKVISVAIAIIGSLAIGRLLRSCKLGVLIGA